MKKTLIFVLTVLLLLMAACGKEPVQATYDDEKLPIPTYPLTEELVKEELEKIGVVADVQAHEINPEEHPGFERSAYSIRPTESSLLYASINNGCTGEDRFLAFTLLSFDDNKEITKEEFKNAILFASRLFGGFENEETIHKAFMDNFDADESWEWEAEVEGVECQIKFQYTENTSTYIMNLSFYTDKAVFLEKK